MTSRHQYTSSRRGGILFEVLLSFALFMGAAAFTLTAVRSVLGSLDRVSMKQEAVDLVKSKLAELEAGLITLADLRDGASADETEKWVFDVRTSRTEYTNLTLVELTVRQTQSPSSSQSEDDSFSFTLRQLIVLRDVDAQPFERDEMSEVRSE